jgi:hypothetical protein
MPNITRCKFIKNLEELQVFNTLSNLPLFFLKQALLLSCKFNQAAATPDLWRLRIPLHENRRRVGPPHQWPSRAWQELRRSQTGAWEREKKAKIFEG